MRVTIGRIFEFFPRLLTEFLPGLFVDLIRWLFPRHERHYFVANEVVFQISHPANTSLPDILDAVRIFLPFNRNFFQQLYVSLIPASGNDWRNRLNPPPESLASTSPNSPTSKVITISSSEPFSLVPVRIAWHSRSGLRPVAVSRVLQVAYAQLQDGPIDLGNGISLQSISPNWFAKNLHHGGNTGGPGSWPLEVQGPTHSTRWDHEFLLPGSTGATSTGGTVHVAILDTIPLQRFQSVAQSLVPASAVTTAPTPDYALIQYLFLSGSLDIHPYANPAELAALHSYTPLRDHYEMPDHGTFIAGIIHTIAPTATIHLYEVLNSFGLGTLTSVAQSLIDVINNHYGSGNTPLIINCSFVLDPFTSSSDPTLTQVLNLTNPQISGLTTRSILGVLNWITSLNNVVVVASAGNEANLGARPPAYYPAAHQHVIGVGALPHDYPTYPSGEYRPASYSNLSYDPANKTSHDGFMTFGGDIDNPGSPQSNVQPVASQGVLGVYLGDFPSRRTANDSITRTRSTKGWARWAGTSFAAPMIAGFLAARWSRPVAGILNYSNARNDLQTFTHGETHAGETVIHIRQ